MSEVVEDKRMQRAHPNGMVARGKRDKEAHLLQAYKRFKTAFLVHCQEQQVSRQFFL